jgi:hypothetical protein
VPGATDALDDAYVVATTVNRDPHGATCSRPSSSRVKVMSWLAAARASPAVSAATTHVRTTSQRPVLPEW